MMGLSGTTPKLEVVSYLSLASETVTYVRGRNISEQILHESNNRGVTLGR